MKLATTSAAAIAPALNVPSVGGALTVRISPESALLYRLSSYFSMSGYLQLNPGPPNLARAVQIGELLRSLREFGSDCLEMLSTGPLAVVTAALPPGKPVSMLPITLPKTKIWTRVRQEAEQLAGK